MHLNGFMCLLTFYFCHLRMCKFFQYFANKQLISALGQTHLLREWLFLKQDTTFQ